MRSLILLLLFGCFSARGQEQITDFVTEEIKSEKLLPVGKMGDYFYTITPDLGISRVHTATRELSSFLKIPQAANRSFDGIIAGNQLYFYDTRIDSSKVTIYKVNGTSYQKVLTIPEARAVVKNGEMLYVTCDKGLKRVNLKQELAGVETLIPESRVEGDVSPYSVFDLRDSVGKHISRAFVDSANQLHRLNGEVYGPLTGQDVGDLVLFFPRHNPIRYYYYDKKSEEFKPLMVSGKGHLTHGVLSEFIEMEGRHFAVHNYNENVSNEIKGVIVLYELLNGVLHEVFAERTSLFTYYNNTHPAAGAFVPALYSNFIGKDGRIFFWAKSSLQYTEGFDFRLNTIDIRKKELKSVALNNTEIFNRMNREKGVVSLYLSPAPQGVYTHNLKDDRINFEYDEATGSFREVNLYAPRNVHSASLNLLLNFTYPNRLIAYDTNHNFRQVLRLETPVKKLPVDEVVYNRDVVFFINSKGHEIHIFDGKELKSNKLQFANDFNEIDFWGLIPASGSNFLLLGVHGVRSDGVEGGHLYSVNKTTFDLVKIKTFEAGYNNTPFHVSRSSGPMALICVNGTDYSYTDYSPGNTVFIRDKALGEWAMLIHAFNSSAAVLRNGEETFYYNFKTRTKTYLTGPAYKNYGYGSRFFYTYKDDLYFVNQEGNKTRVATVGNDFSNQAEEAGDYLMYRQANRVGLLSKYSGKYMEFNIPSGSLTRSKVLVLNGVHYLLAPSEIIKLDAEKGVVETTRTNIKEIMNPSVFGNKILFHEAFAPEYEKSRIWSFEDGKLQVLVDELNLKGNGHQLLNQPVGFNNKPTLNHAFWIPEKEKLFYFTGHDFSDNGSINYMGFANGNHYFYSSNTRLNKWELFVFNVATEEFKSALLETPDMHRVYFFKDNVFNTSDRSIWQLTGTEQEIFTDLVPVRVTGTDLFTFKNNLYVWAKDEYGVAQVFRITENEEEPGVLLPSESPTLNFSFYPNPTVDYLTISSNTEGQPKYKVTVFSTDGKVLSEKESELPQKLDLSGLKSGVYLINVKTGQRSETFRVLKQ